MPHSHKGRRAFLADEQTPLLVSTTQDPANQINGAEVVEDTEDGKEAPDHASGATKSNDDDDKPLPMGQILVLCISRFVDPVSFFCIFPFIPKMVETMNVREEDVGFYTGLIVSTFTLTAHPCRSLTTSGIPRFCNADAHHVLLGQSSRSLRQETGVGCL